MRIKYITGTDDWYSNADWWRIQNDTLVIEEHQNTQRIPLIAIKAFAADGVPEYQEWLEKEVENLKERAKYQSSERDALVAAVIERFKEEPLSVYRDGKDVIEWIPADDS